MSGIRTRSGVKSLTDTNLPSGTGAITALNHRAVHKSVADSAVLFGEAEVIVVNMSTTTPPGSPSDRDAYVVAAGATGAWAGQDDNVAIWDASVSPAAWVFVTPTDGMAVWNLADDKQYRWDAGVSPAAWVTGLGAAVLADTTTTLTVGYSHTPHAIGTISSGTVTPDEANGAMQNYTNGGAHTLAPPANSTSLHIVITNNGSAGGITTSGFSVVTGDAFTTTDADVFLCAITKNGSVSHLHVTAVP